MTTTRIVRRSREIDLPQILEILNREILEGTAHFGLEPMSLEALTREFGGGGKYPWFSAVEDDHILGFARASTWKSRGAYSKTCEVGVYVRPELHGQGIARSIYREFLPALRECGFHTVLGGIALPNPASIKLHENFGFVHVGTLPEVGWKHGRWRDVGYWALTYQGDSSRTGID